MHAHQVKYLGRDLNPHDHYWPQDFKSCVSTNSTTKANTIVDLFMDDLMIYSRSLRADFRDADIMNKISFASCKSFSSTNTISDSFNNSSQSKDSSASSTTIESFEINSAFDRALQAAL